MDLTVICPMIPRPAPPGTKIMWKRTAPGIGHFYIHGAVFRKEGKSYLLRVSSPERNDSVACLMMPDGSIRNWYYDWEQRAEEIHSVLEEAKKFVLAHHILTS